MTKQLIYTLFLIFGVMFFFNACKTKSDPDAPLAPKLIFKFKFNPNQERLGSNGQPTNVPAGNAAQNPRFNKMSQHYIELTPNANTIVGGGKVLYIAPERTMSNGDKAIEFDQSVMTGENETFFSVPLKDVIGNYQYLRISLAYQNYDVNFTANINGTNTDLTGTLASFIGFRTYINTVKIKNQTVAVNAAKTQGFWAFETNTGTTNTGQSAGTTTVPNPIAATSPIPLGSCLVTGIFQNSSSNTPLVITGNETNDIVVQVNLSTNNSFEWVDGNGNGKWEPLLGESVVDMGVRGMKPIFFK